MVPVLDGSARACTLPCVAPACCICIACALRRCIIVVRSCTLKYYRRKLELDDLAGKTICRTKTQHMLNFPIE